MRPDDTSTHLPETPGATVGAGSTSPGADAFDARYRIDRVIASGGMGVVVAATHKHLGTRVAIKLLHEVTDNLRQRFLREAKLAATFASPHVARVTDYGFNESGQPYLVMEHVEGRTLKARMAAGRDAPDHASQAEVLRLARELLSALVDVHRAGVVHRDVKPANVMLVPDATGVEHVKLIDFGIAKRVDPRATDADLTGSGEVLGTVSYMAPEQIVGAAVDPRADVFSFGVVLYEMLSGRRAFETSARSFTVAMSQGRSDVPFAPLRSVVTGVDSRLEAVVARCLEVDPARRYADAAAVLDALPRTLETSLQATSSQATSSQATSSEIAPVSIPAFAAPDRTRRALIWGGAVASVIAVGIVVAVWATRPEPPVASEDAPVARPTPAMSSSPATDPTAERASAPTASATDVPVVAASSNAAAPTAWRARPPVRGKGTTAPRLDDRH